MEPEVSQPALPPRPNVVFFNDHGLRAGWRLLIYIALIFCLLFAILTPLAHKLQPLAGHGAPGPEVQAAVETFSFLLFLLAAFIMSRIERRRMGDYGLPLKSARVLQRFVTGYVFWGFLPLYICLLVLHIFHAYDFGSLALHGRDIWIWGAKWGVVFVMVGLSEEFLLRGYSLFTLADGIGFWPAAIFMAALFGLGHAGNTGETRIGLIATVVFALFASTTLRYTGNLWLAVGAHAGWDWGQSFFFGVNDSGFQAPGHLLSPSVHGPVWLSGGSVGPEGSIVTLILWALMSIIFVLLYRKRAEPALVITEAPKY
jgi:membrane protease YdiL (CAAX protease family)